MKKFLIYLLSLSFIFIISCKNPIIDVYELSFANTPQSININGQDVFLSNYIYSPTPFYLHFYKKNGDEFELPANYSIGKVFIFYYKTRFISPYGPIKEKIDDNNISLSISDYNNTTKKVSYDKKYPEEILFTRISPLNSFIVIEIINEKKEIKYLKSNVKTLQEISEILNPK